MYPQVRQGKVTDRKKEAIGAKPTRTWDPRSLPAHGDDSSSSDDDGPWSGRAARPARIKLLFRAGQLLLIKPARGENDVWLALLLENVMERPGRQRRAYNQDRPRVLYFVRSCELDTWPAASKFWARTKASTDGLDYDTVDAAVQRRLQTLAVADAHATADCSDGVHFSYAGSEDRVSIEAVYGTVDRSFERETVILEGVPRLVRFAISAAAMELAIGRVKERGAPAPVDSSEDEPSSSSGDEGAQLASPVRPALVLAHGRRVRRVDYSAML